MFNTATKLEKVSDNIISQIRDAILSGKLKPGDRLASEKELIGQFGVSKATMREALRVLEVMGLIEIRKGIGGGAFVAEVDMKTTIHSIINFLHFQPISIREITMLRYLIEPTAAQLAATSITPVDIDNLKKLVSSSHVSRRSETEKEISFHRYLARMSNNAILILIVDFLDNLLRSIKTKLNLEVEFYESVQKKHEMILECLIQHDPVAAGIAMANDLLEVGQYMSRIDHSKPFEPADLELVDAYHDQFRMNPDARVVSEDDPCLQQPGTLIKRIGSSRLFLVLGKGQDHLKA